MSRQNSTGVVIVAGGKGVRAGGAGNNCLPKQYQDLAGIPVIARTISAFLDHPKINYVQPVIASGAEQYYAAAIAGLQSEKLLPPVTGGPTRQESVRCGLGALANRRVENVLVHDAARPLVDQAIISDVLDLLTESNGVISAVPVSDTLKRTREDQAVICDTVDRARLWAAQTPQGFKFDQLLAAHELAAGNEFTDDAALFEAAGHSVVIVSGKRSNIKITHPEDFEMAERLMGTTQFEFRTGQGFDVHKFEPGDSVILCGIEIPNSQKLAGHSDADVAMHALTDAILGAICAGDIGSHFPPGEEKWKGAASEIFLREACRLVQTKGGLLTHCDVTIICETPKMGPHREAMRESLARISGCDVDRVSVKATTTEKLGFTGRGEGISALAVATIRLPVSED